MSVDPTPGRGLTKSGRAGRPSKFSEQRAELILQAIRAGNSRTCAAGVAGIGEATLRGWLACKHDFREAVEKAESDAEAAAVLEIRNAYTSGVWTAAAWWLERRRHKDWGKVDRVEVTIKQTAERLASELNCDASELIAEAERIVARVG